MLRRKLELLGIKKGSTVAELKEAGRILGLALSGKKEAIESQLFERLRELSLQEVRDRVQEAQERAEQVRLKASRREKEGMEQYGNIDIGEGGSAENPVILSGTRTSVIQPESTDDHGQAGTRVLGLRQARDGDNAGMMERVITKEHLPAAYWTCRPTEQPKLIVDQEYMEFLMPRSKGKIFEQPMSRKEREDLMEQHPIVDKIDLDPPAQPIAVQIKIDQDKRLKKLDKQFKTIQSMGLDAL